MLRESYLLTPALPLLTRGQWGPTYRTPAAKTHSRLCARHVEHGLTSMVRFSKNYHLLVRVVLNGRNCEERKKERKKNKKKTTTTLLCLLRLAFEPSVRAFLWSRDCKRIHRRMNYVKGYCWLPVGQILGWCVVARVEIAVSPNLFFGNLSLSCTRYIVARSLW